jgi:hypothetical protein
MEVRVKFSNKLNIPEINRRIGNVVRVAPQSSVMQDFLSNLYGQVAFLTGETEFYKSWRQRIISAIYFVSK